jgi:hypothetical protein
MKPKPDEDLPLLAGKKAVTANLESREAPARLEFKPLASVEGWRVEKFAELATCFGLLPPFDTAMRDFMECGRANPQPFTFVRQLYGICPLMPPTDARLEDLEAHSRAELCALHGIEAKQLDAELDVMRGIWNRTRAVHGDEKPAAAAEPEPPRDELRYGHEVLAEFGFDEEMFEVVYVDGVGKDRRERKRGARENRIERDWFAKRVTEWRKMLSETMGGGLAREALMNELYLRRLTVDMGRLMPNSAQFERLAETKRHIEEAYERQLTQLEEKFPEMAVAGKVNFRGCTSDWIRGYREYRARGDRRLIDRVCTAAEMAVDLRQSVQAPEARHRFGLKVAIIEAIHGIYDPEFRPQFRHSDLKKLDELGRRVIDEVRQRQNEPLVDLENGVAPGEGDDYPDLPDMAACERCEKDTPHVDDKCNLCGHERPI